MTKCIDRRIASIEDLAADYKARGMDRFRAWSQFVIDRGLRPGIDAKAFYSIYDQVGPCLLEQHSRGVLTTPTHILTDTSGTAFRVALLDDDGVIVRYTTECGSEGSHPKSLVQSIEAIGARVKSMRDCDQYPG